MADAWLRARRALSCLPLMALILLAPASVPAASLSEAQLKQLADSRYVYVSSQRKDGSFSPPAEIWFMVHDGAVWVGTLEKSWRARRIAAGRTAAKVRIGSPTGPEFDATAAIVSDAAAWKVLFDSLARKYPDGWPKHEKAFRDGAADGTRVLIRYSPR